MSPYHTITWWVNVPNEVEVDGCPATLHNRSHPLWGRELFVIARACISKSFLQEREISGASAEATLELERHKTPASAGDRLYTAHYCAVPFSHIIAVGQQFLKSCGVGVCSCGGSAITFECSFFDVMVETGIRRTLFTPETVAWLVRHIRGSSKPFVDYGFCWIWTSMKRLRIEILSVQETSGSVELLPGRKIHLLYGSVQKPTAVFCRFLNCQTLWTIEWHYLIKISKILRTVL